MRKKKLTFKELYNIISLVTLIAIYLVFLIVYTMAFLHPSGQMIFDVNYFHEKHVEALLFLLTAPRIVGYFKRLNKEES